MKKISFKTIVSMVVILAVIAPLSFAQAATLKANAHAAAGTVAKGKADAAITARTTALTDLLNRVNEMTKISDTDKAALVATINTNLSNISTLKTKIDSDTDKATLKADTQSITKAYRIYALILPQTRILAAADRVAATVDILTNVEAKLATGITQAQAAGKDVTLMNSTNTDLNAKLTDATTKGQAAQSLVAGLVPDQGSATVAASNKTARDDIKAAITDLVAAVQDSKTIRASLTTDGVTVQ